MTIPFAVTAVFKEVFGAVNGVSRRQSSSPVLVVPISRALNVV